MGGAGDPQTASSRADSDGQGADSDEGLGKAGRGSRRRPKERDSHGFVVPGLARLSCGGGRPGRDSAGLLRTRAAAANNKLDGHVRTATKARSGRHASAWRPREYGWLRDYDWRLRGCGATAGHVRGATQVSGKKDMSQYAVSGKWRAFAASTLNAPRARRIHPCSNSCEL